MYEETEEERKKRKSDLVAASFEAELNWQEQLIFTWGRLTELEKNNKRHSGWLVLSGAFSLLGHAICNLCLCAGKVASSTQYKEIHKKKSFFLLNLAVLKLDLISDTNHEKPE